jgi:hypothetical protein
MQKALPHIAKEALDSRCPAHEKSLIRSAERFLKKIFLFTLNDIQAGNFVPLVPTLSMLFSAFENMYERHKSFYFFSFLFEVNCCSW